MATAQVWAHRGASAYAPENTLAAFQRAVDMKADGIELDVHRTKDGEIVVVHDETIDRCSDGKGYVCDMTLSELRQYDFAKRWPDYSPQRIPTLSQVLELMKPTGLRVNIEIKSNVIKYPGIEAEVVRIVRSRDMNGQVVCSSFNYDSLLLVRQAEPQAYIGVPYRGAVVRPWALAEKYRAQAVHPYYPTLLMPGIIDGCREAGIDVNAWTADRYEDCLRLAKAGIHAIITNRPDVAQSAISDAINTPRI